MKPAHERERVVEAERVEPLPRRALAGHAAIAVDRACADAFDALEQGCAAVGTDDIAEQAAEIADVRVLGNRSRWFFHG